MRQRVKPPMSHPHHYLKKQIKLKRKISERSMTHLGIQLSLERKRIITINTSGLTKLIKLLDTKKEITVLAERIYYELNYIIEISIDIVHLC